jgi:hypothetical protein
VGKQQHRPLGAGAAQARHQIAHARRRLEHLHVNAVKAGCNQPRRHGVGGASGVAGLGDSVDLDELLVDFEGLLLLGRQRMCTRPRGDRKDEDCSAAQGLTKTQPSAAMRRQPAVQWDAGEGVRHGNLLEFEWSWCSATEPDAGRPMFIPSG